MASFDISGKVALVTGGASGIGLTYAEQFLENGIKGVTLADINETTGVKVARDLKEKYGENRVVFVKTDVTDYQQFEGAFKKTVDAFNHLDILINNAGTDDETQHMWRKTVEVNVIGVLNGIVLGLEHYLPTHKSAEEALIVNTCSISGLHGIPYHPIYSATKFAVHGATLSFGRPAHHDRHGVRVVAVCPGLTRTPLTSNRAIENIKNVHWQTLEQIAPELLKVVRKAPHGTVWVLEKGERAYQYVLPNRLEVPRVYL